VKSLADREAAVRGAAADFSLYLVFDAAVARDSNVDAERCIRACVAGGAGLVQLRDKTSSRRDLFEAATRLARATRGLGVPFIVNDHLDVALIAGAGGVHLGAEDLPVCAARRLAPAPFLIGATARSVEEALRAEGEGASYLGVGSLRASGTKKAPAMSVETARRIAAAVRIPVVAIGGIDAPLAVGLRGTGLAGVAVCSALLAASDPEAASREIRAAFLGHEDET
jgi:thiamine-phosphate pyrophosphorylase